MTVQQSFDLANTPTEHPLRTTELLARLQRHYIKPGDNLPGGLFLPEVGWNGATAGGCDAIYVGFTTTSGRILVGHELKVSRADWVKELTTPGKSDGWADQCHQWYLVVGDPEIVRDGELPAGWGLMVPGRSKTRMDIKVKAETKTGHNPSWLAVRSIMARQDTLRAASIAAARQRANEAAQAGVREQVDREVARQKGISPDVERARSLVAAIHVRRRGLSAMPNDEPEIEKLADAVCEVLAGKRLLETLRGVAQHRLNQVENAVRDLKADWQYKNLVEQLEATNAVTDA